MIVDRFQYGEVINVVFSEIDHNIYVHKNPDVGRPSHNIFLSNLGIHKDMIVFVVLF